MSDYSSTAVGLLHSDHRPLHEGWIDSGSATPGLTTVLSGDIVLPTVLDRRLVLIDRLGTDVVTVINVPSGEVVSQTSTRRAGPGAPTAYDPNPQDVAFLDDRRALVTRFQPNLDPSATPLDRGSDLLEIDLMTGMVLGRIDLARFGTSVGGEPIPPRPARMAWMADRLVVALNRLSADFMVAGRGAVALVEPTTAAVGLIEFDGLSNCHEVLPIAGVSDEVVVLCAGATFAQQAARRAGAGLVRVGVNQVTVLWRASDHPASPVPTHGGIPIDRARVVAVSTGDNLLPDRLVLYESSGAWAVLAEGAAFDLGTGDVDTANGVILVPDAGRNSIRRFRLPQLNELAPVELRTCHRLPPRALRRMP